MNYYFKNDIYFESQEIPVHNSSEKNDKKNFSKITINDKTSRLIYPLSPNLYQMLAFAYFGGLNFKKTSSFMTKDFIANLKKKKFLLANNNNMNKNLQNSGSIGKNNIDEQDNSNLQEQDFDGNNLNDFLSEYGNFNLDCSNIFSNYEYVKHFNTSLKKVFFLVVFDCLINNKYLNNNDVVFITRVFCLCSCPAMGTRLLDLRF